MGQILDRAKKIFFYDRTNFFYDSIRFTHQVFRFLEWKLSGEKYPAPYIVKQKLVRNWAKKISAKTLIETGTYLGDMVNAVKGDFGKIFSIEISKTLAERAKKRFNDFPHIAIIESESNLALKEIIERGEEPMVFWLDSVFSNGITEKGLNQIPIIEELETILKYQLKKFVILINIRSVMGFGNSEDEVVGKIKELVFKFHPELAAEVKNDVLEIYPKIAFNNQFFSNEKIQQKI